MFKIEVILRPFRYTGIEALDFRRSMLLPDGVMADCHYSYARCEVDEAFARSWFKTDETFACQRIDVGLLRPGELRETGGGSLAIMLDIDPRRLMDLFIAGRFADLKETRKLSD